MEISEDLRNEIALYIHIPFCVHKCFYCDFTSYEKAESLMDEYSNVLKEDIAEVGHRKIKTIFIGGGTPTYMKLSAWENIYNTISKMNIDKNLEFTVEGNPGTFTEEKLKFLKSIGVNRLSMGLQAWQNRILKCIGRIHNINDFISSYALARKLDFSNINIDLMFGLPGQSTSDWKETLTNVVGLHPEHISCYSLIVEKGTPFYEMNKLGKLKLPSEKEERFMYEFTLDFLNSQGYYQYEISNFSRKNFQCRHNLVYWNLEQYIGCGAGAHSYIDGFRYRRTGDLAQYIKEGKNRELLKLDVHENSQNDDMEEFMFMGLRKINGISISDFNSRFKVDIHSIYGDAIKKHLGYGTLKEVQDRMYLTRRGIQVSNSVMCDFILTC